MQNLTASLTRSKKVPDYTTDRFWAKQLAEKVQEYYHAQGYTDVRAWVEPEMVSRGRKVWGVRSNIVFSVANLQQ